MCENKMFTTTSVCMDEEDLEVAEEEIGVISMKNKNSYMKKDYKGYFKEGKKKKES